MRRGRSSARPRVGNGTPRWRRRVGVFTGALAVPAIAFALSAPPSMATIAFPLGSMSRSVAQECDPRVGVEGEAPFTVFYCAGDSTGPRDAAAVAGFLDQAWPEMTQPPPDGLGPPLTSDDDNGGRFRVYVVAPTSQVVLGDCPDLCVTVGNNYGVAMPAPPFIRTRTGAERSGAALVINKEIGINDATVIHEFFHALEFAHTLNGAASWLSETMAVWAEQHYRATETGRLGFFRAFQDSPHTPLMQRGGTLEYGAYVWLVWLAQRTNSARSVFGMWTALSGVTSNDTDAIDVLLDRYLTRLGVGFRTHFKEFGVEDLDLNLSRQVTPQLFNRGRFGDRAVPLDLTPILVRRPWTLGLTPRRTSVRLARLSMQYDNVRAITQSVGAVTVRTSGIRPWGDVVVLARATTGWQRVDLQNGSVTFCRFTNRGNVSTLFVIGVNHDLRRAHSGSYTVSAQRACPSRQPVTRRTAPA